MPFTHVLGSGATGSGAGNTATITLGAAPTQGNLVCFGIVITAGTTAIPTISGLVIEDSNGNVYTVTPQSPSAEITQTGNTFPTSTTGATYAAYLLSAPANASATITATWTVTGGGGGMQSTQIFADEFSYTGGSAVFDTSVAATNVAGATTVTTPSITPTHAGSLIYNTTGSCNTITAVGGTWVAGGGGAQNGDESAYVLSQTGALAADYTQSGSYGWSGVSMAFFIASAGNPGAGYNRMPVFMLG